MAQQAVGPSKDGLRHGGVSAAAATASAVVATAARAAVERLEGRTLFAMIGSATLDVLPNVNTSRMLENQNEATIAVNPANRNQVFVASVIDAQATDALDDVDQDGDGIPDPPRYANRTHEGLRTLFVGTSTDGGANWTPRELGTSADGLTPACCDPSAAFDRFGNLFLTYIDRALSTVVLAMSTDGGATFTILPSYNLGGIDQPTIKTANVGNESVTWLTFQLGGQIVATGSRVTGLGQANVSPFSTLQAAPNSTGGNFGDIEVGPNGEVMVTWQSPSGGEGPAVIAVNTDPDGLGPQGFGQPVIVARTDVGGFDFIPAQNGRSVDAEAGLAWDRSGGPHRGRVYLVYTDEAESESSFGLFNFGGGRESGSDLNVFVRLSEDQGKTWSLPIRVNDNTGNRASQFLPRMAIDQTTGNVGVVWHDTRNDANRLGPVPNDEAQFWGTVGIPTAGGVRFVPDVQISAGTSVAARARAVIEYGDYTALDFYDGVMYPAWADNSNSTGDNPSGGVVEPDDFATFDVYTSRVLVTALGAPSDQPVPLSSPLAPDFVGKSQVRGGRAFTFKVSFTSPQGVDVNSIQGSDLRVVGPNGFVASPELLRVKPSKDGTSAVATFRLTPPDRRFDRDDNGVYRIFLLPDAVRAASGGAVTQSGVLDQFVVASRAKPKPGAGPALADDFEDRNLDPAKFRTVIPTQDFLPNGLVANSRVQEINGRVEITDKAYLVTQQQFVPSPTSPLVISGEFTFIDPRSPLPYDALEDGEIATVLTRTPGTPDQAFFGEGTGVFFRIWAERPENTAAGGTTRRSFLQIGERNAGETSIRSLASTSGNQLDLVQGDTVRFTITDNGTDVTLEAVELENGQPSTTSRDFVQAASTLTTGSNFVAFYNREVTVAQNSRILGLDDLTIRGGGVAGTTAQAAARRASALPAGPSVAGSLFGDTRVPSSSAADLVDGEDGQ